MVERVELKQRNSPRPRARRSEMVVQVVQALQAVYRLFGFDDTGWAAKPTLDHWRSCVKACGDDWVKFTKYKLSAFYSVYLDQPLPRPPAGLGVIHGSPRGIAQSDYTEVDYPNVLLGGKAHRWLRARLAEWSFERRLEFLYSVKSSKKGMPRPGKDYLDKAIRDTKKVLTTPKPDPLFQQFLPRRNAWADIEELPVGVPLYLTRASVEEQLDRTVRELFGGARLTDDDVERPFFPSTSANYVRSRAKGGAVGEVLGYVRQLSLLIQDEPDAFNWTNLSGIDVRFNEVFGLGVEGGVRAAFTVDDYEFRTQFRHLYTSCVARAMDEEHDVELVALPEALKVRVISKGPPFSMFALKPLQRFMWDRLSRHPAFLVGGPVDNWVVQDRLGGRLRDDEAFLSGDYAAATDELCSWVSDRIAVTLSRLCGLTIEEQHLLRMSLTGHTIEGQLQQNGQLMGSVTSFPILCIANAALSRWAYELGHNVRRTLKDWPGVVNGDDIAMRCNTLARQLWFRVTSFAGLIESVGKTYYDRRFVEMNSRVFLFDADPAVRSWCAAAVNNHWRYAHYRMVGFVNLGLIRGMKRSGGQTREAECYGPNSFGQVAQELRDCAPTALKDAVLRLYVRHNFDSLSRTNLPWYMPEWLGGLGLPCWWDDQTGEYHGPSLDDVRKGQFIKRHYDTLAPRTVSDARWQMDRLFREYALIKPIVVEDTEAVDELKKASDRFYGAGVVSLLFNGKIKMRDLLPDRKGGGFNSYLRATRYNRAIWRKAVPAPCRVADMQAIFGDLAIPLVEVYDVQIL